MIQTRPTRHCACVIDIRRGRTHVYRTRASTEDRERWTYNTAHNRLRRPQKPRPGKENLKHLHRFIFLCPCGALAEYNSALKQARKAKRKTFKPKDGCSGRKCCGPRTKFWPAKFWPLQRKWRNLIRRGDRDLIKLPRLPATTTLTLLQHMPRWVGPRAWPVMRAHTQAHTARDGNPLHTMTTSMRKIRVY